MIEQNNYLQPPKRHKYRKIKRKDMAIDSETILDINR